MYQWSDTTEVRALQIRLKSSTREGCGRRGGEVQS